jgi:hemerythrin-like domain-containing protein
MLAAESAWRVFRTEHARMRELLSSIDATLQKPEWQRAGPALDSLREALRRLRTFEDVTHKPKGVKLLATLRGRSPDADSLLDRLAREKEQCADLLSQALALLDRVEAGDPQAAAECTAVLGIHRKLMLAYLHTEDTVLHSHTARLLTPEEWSSVVSSMSSVVRRAGR